MIRAAVAGLLLLTGCATPAVEHVAESGCEVEVRFGSYAMGVDRELKDSVLQLVGEDSGVLSSTESPWGREGESTLCVQTDNARTADRVYEGIVALLPPHSDRAPTTVIHADGRRREVGLPPERAR